MNVILLQMVRDKILEEPRQFNMYDWFNSDLPNGEVPANCGTACCIGGWAQTIAKEATPEEAWNSTWVSPSLLLGLDDKQSNRLFFEANWPKQFRSSDKAGLKLRAKRAAARINLFIKTKGKV